jgi:hypothetical protein
VTAAPAVVGEPALVPGELRGYRQFHLLGDGLYPLVHRASGPWDGRQEEARCASGGDHSCPAADCRCGLYACYRPGSATIALGGANAVIAARGRCILGDRGFRAASARIEAVALPGSVRWRPGAASRIRRLLAERYPDTRVYGSTRRMLREHPPQDVRGLGIMPARDPSRGYRSAAAALWAGFVVAGYSLALLPRGTVAHAGARWWPLVVLVVVVWQAALIWLLGRLMAEQTPDHHGTAQAADPPAGS